MAGGGGQGGDGETMGRGDPGQKVRMMGWPAGIRPGQASRRVIVKLATASKAAA